MRLLRLAALAQNDMGFRVVRVPSPSWLWKMPVVRALRDRTTEEKISKNPLKQFTLGVVKEVFYRRFFKVNATFEPKPIIYTLPGGLIPSGFCNETRLHICGLSSDKKHISITYSHFLLQNISCQVLVHLVFLQYNSIISE